MKKESNRGAGSARKFDILILCVLVLACIFPALGFGAYFRNEDARYLIWMRDGFFRPFDATFIKAMDTFRPVTWIVLRVLYDVWGFAPLAYQLVSAACFIGAITLLYAIGTRLFESRRTAFLSILVYFACFYFTFHFLYTPIQGLQYPIELFLVAAAIYIMLGALPKGTFGYPVVAAAALSVLAVFNHPVSAFLLPALAITLTVIGWRRCSRDGQGRTKRPAGIITIALFASLWLLMPFLSSHLEKEPGGVLGYVPEMMRQYLAYGSIFLRGINRVLMPFALMYLIARSLSARHASRVSPFVRLLLCATASLAGVLLFLAIPATACFVLLTAMIAGVAFTGWQRFFLGIWFFAGMLPLLTSEVVTGVYMRHPALALSLLLGVSFSALIEDAVAAAGERVRRLGSILTLERCAAVITAVATLAVLIAGLHIAHVPVISRQVEQIEYLKDMGNNFRDTVKFLSMNIEKNGTVYFYRGPTRDEEDRYAYTSSHLARLQPAKYNHYPFYFAMREREDIAVRFTDELAPGAAGAVIVATNNWEVREIESTYAFDTWREFRRGTALARIYRLRTE